VTAGANPCGSDRIGRFVRTSRNRFDNSADADPARGVAPHPVLLLHLHHGRVVGADNLSATPAWARRSSPPRFARAPEARRHAAPNTLPLETTR